MTLAFPSPGEDVRMAPAERSKKVLFVDDEDSIRVAFKRALRDSGFDTYLARDLTEALVLATDHDFAVVVTDQMMPGGNGFDVVSRLSLVQPQAKFVLLTGREVYLDPRDKVSDWISEIIYKPWSNTHLVATLSRLVGRLDGAMMLSDSIVSSMDEAHILVIEDNPADADFLVEQFDIAGMHPRVSYAESLAEAKDLITANDFDAAFVDLTLPDARGLAAVNQTQAMAPTLPLVVLSGHEDGLLAAQAIEMGVHDYLSKGNLQPSEIGRTLRHTIVRGRAVRQLSAEPVSLNHLDTSQERFLDRTRLAIGLAKRWGVMCAVVRVGIPSLSEVTSLGASSAFQLLAQRVSSVLRETDTVYTIPRGELAILLVDVDPHYGTGPTASRIASIIAESTDRGGDVTAEGTGVAIGIATYPSAMSANDLWAQAGRNLRVAVGAGGGIVDEMDEQYRSPTSPAALTEAMQQQRGFLRHSPFVSLAPREITGIQVSPFLDIAPLGGAITGAVLYRSVAQCGLAQAFAQWLFAKAFDDTRIILEGGLRNIRPIALHLASQLLFQRQFAASVRSLGRDNPLAGRMELVVDVEALATFGKLPLQRVCEPFLGMGIFVTLRDLWSPILLAGVRARSMYLDLSSRHLLAAPPGSAGNIAGAIADMAHRFSMRVRAVNIDSDEGFRIALKVGAESVSGPSVAKPMARDALLGWLQDADSALSMFQQELRGPAKTR